MTISSHVRDGLTLDAIDWGLADGDPVVLLHGFPERATCWREVSPILRGYSPGARPLKGPQRRRSAYLALFNIPLLPELVFGRGPYEFFELTGVSYWIPTKTPQAAADAIFSTIARTARS